MKDLVYESGTGKASGPSEDGDSLSSRFLREQYSWAQQPRASRPLCPLPKGQRPYSSSSEGGMMSQLAITSWPLEQCEM